MPRKTDFKQTLCAPTSAGSACTPLCAAAQKTARRWNNSAATHAPGTGQRNGQRKRANQRRRASGAQAQAWREGTTHLVMPPMEFMQRLAALASRL